MRESVHAQQQRGSVRQREFLKQQFEDGPGVVRVLGAEEGEAGEGDVGGDGDGEGVFGGWLGELEGFEEGVRAGDGGEEGGGVGPLGVEGGGCGGEGGVLCVG